MMGVMNGDVALACFLTGLFFLLSLIVSVSVLGANPTLYEWAPRRALTRTMIAIWAAISMVLTALFFVAAIFLIVL